MGDGLDPLPIVLSSTVLTASNKVASPKSWGIWWSTFFFGSFEGCGRSLDKIENYSQLETLVRRWSWSMGVNSCVFLGILFNFCSFFIGVFPFWEFGGLGFWCGDGHYSRRLADYMQTPIGISLGKCFPLQTNKIIWFSKYSKGINGISYRLDPWIRCSLLRTLLDSIV
jgi:hypothetical protein